MKDFDEWLNEPSSSNNRRKQLEEELGLIDDPSMESFMGDVEDFAENYDDATCQCGSPGVMPPCSFCTHPGNFTIDGPIREYLTEIGYLE